VVRLTSEEATLPIAAAIPAIVGVASAGATIYSASQQSKANKKGLAVQQAAADRAAGFEEQKYADLAPWRSYGLGALQQLAQVNGITIPQSTFDNTGSSKAAAASAYLQQNPDVAAGAQREISNPKSDFYGASPEEYAQYHYDTYGKSEGRTFQAPAQAPATTTPTGTPTTGNPTAASADPRLAGFFASPDYGFRVQEGTSAITGNTASRGLLDSGATGKALINYGQQAGSAEFSNWYNRLSAAAGVGQAATTQSGQALTNQGNIAQNQAQNQASSYQTQAGINNGLVGGLVGIGSGLLQQYGGGGGGSAAGRYVPTTNNTVGVQGALQGQGPGVFNDSTLRTLYGAVL
jgi:hypothetical protein